MDKYFLDINFIWFVVIENGKVVYSVAQYSRDKHTGIYPEYANKKEGASFYDGIYKNKRANLKDLYKYVCDNLNK